MDIKRETKMMQTKVKMCGLRRVEEIQLAHSLGVDAIGFVLYPASKRALSLDEAVALRTYIQPPMQLVVLMVNPSIDEVNAVIHRVKPDILQFHGDESGEFCEQFAYPYWRAVRVGAPELRTADELKHYMGQYPNAQKFLFDAYSSGHYGGSGIRFDLRILDALTLDPQRYIIAGGINISNVDEVVGHYPFIDLSSGIEEEAGVKSLTKMRDFMAYIHAQTAENTR